MSCFIFCDLPDTEAKLKMKDDTYMRRMTDEDDDYIFIFIMFVVGLFFFSIISIQEEVIVEIRALSR